MYDSRRRCNYSNAKQVKQEYNISQSCEHKLAQISRVVTTKITQINKSQQVHKINLHNNNDAIVLNNITQVQRMILSHLHVFSQKRKISNNLSSASLITITVNQTQFSWCFYETKINIPDNKSTAAFVSPSCLCEVKYPQRKR